MNKQLSLVQIRALGRKQRERATALCSLLQDPQFNVRPFVCGSQVPSSNVLTTMASICSHT